MRISLVGGSYISRSIIANCQRCINVFPEVNAESAPVPFTFYSRPGLRPLTTPDIIAPVRGLYRASNGQGYACIGQNIYSVGGDWSLTKLGSLISAFSTPVSMIDNGTDLVIVDGSINGYLVNLATQVFSQIIDPTGTFVGANWVDVIDGFIVWNSPGTNQWGSTHDNQILPFDPLYVAFKQGYPDPIVSIVVNRREIFLLGQLKSEVWYDAGNPFFPFAELPGSYIEHGCAATYSVARNDINTYWLHQDLRGQGLVVQQQGYNTTRVSNHGVEVAIRRIANSVGIADAIGYCYQQDGHSFYVLNFPAGNQTWVFDESIPDPTMAWHQRAWTDINGNLNRDRGNCHAFLYGTNVIGDFENGTLYALDLDSFTDTIDGTQRRISRIRTFPHITKVQSPNGPFLIDADGKMMQFQCFRADFECGTSSKIGPKISLNVSRDRGRTFQSEVLISAGEQGQYLTQPLWRTLGQARDMIFELEWSFDGEAALNGAWIDATITNQ